MKEDGISLQYAASLREADRQLVAGPVNQNGSPLRSSAPLVQVDRATWTGTGSRDPGCTGTGTGSGGVPGRLDRCDAPGDIATALLEAVKQNEISLQYAASEPEVDRELAPEAVKHNGISIQCVASERKVDRELVPEAVKQI